MGHLLQDTDVDYAMAQIAAVSRTHCWPTEFQADVVLE